MPPDRSEAPSASARPASDRDERPAAFLDRDGVINVDHGYTHRPEDLVFTPTAIEAIRMLNAGGYRVIVVTNQAGVARGLFDIAAVERFHDHLRAELARRGAYLDAIYYCAFHPDGSIAAFARDHDDRKPGPGMLLRAMEDFPVARARSFLIGDKPSDAEAAARAGIRAMLIETNTGDLAAAVRAMTGS